VSNELDVLYDEIPQLREKAIIDFINGIEVNDDIIRLRDSVNSSFKSRLLQDLTGEAHDRQQQIDQNLQGGLSAVADWLEVLQNYQIQSDLAIESVSIKLAETRQGVMKLQSKHIELKGKVEDLVSRFDNLDNKFSKLEQKLHECDSGRLATQQMEAVFDKWMAGGFDEYPWLIRLYLALDELYWGDFGRFCRTFTDNKIEIERLLDQVKNKAIIHLKENMKVLNMQSDQVFSWQEEVESGLNHLSNDRKKALAFLTDSSDQRSTPVFWALHNYLTNQSEKYSSLDNMPYIFNAENVVEHITENFRVRSGI